MAKKGKADKNKAKKAAKKLGGMSGKAAKALSGRKKSIDDLEAEILGLRPKHKRRR